MDEINWTALRLGIHEHQETEVFHMPNQKPSVGRIVHYMSYGTPNEEYEPEHRAAIITAVHPDTGRENGFAPRVVDLCVLNPTGLFFNQSVVRDEDTKAGGTWHWPERV